MASTYSTLEFEALANNAVVGAIVVNTDNVSFYAFKTNSTLVLNSCRVPISNIARLQDGRAEQDPVALLEAVRECVDQTVTAGQVMGLPVATVGIANHPASVVAWNRRTGAPLSNLILGSDNRTAVMVEKYARAFGKYRFQTTCGLPFSPLFSAFTIKWLIDNDIGINEAYRKGDCFFGTVDTWLLWNLTGGENNGVFATDTTNAANTFLMNINTMWWDPRLLSFFKIAMGCLPTIKSSSSVYGRFAGGQLKDTLISAIMGNRQAALVGHRCFRRGTTKITLDAAGSVFYITGESKVFSSYGLMTTIAYHLDTRPVYALEGPIASVGTSIEWTKKFFHIKESDCNKNKDSKYSMFFVPAFHGLYAPHWRPMSRCALVGMNHYTYQSSILRAAMESVSFQTKDVLEAMQLDSKAPMDRLKVDGYLSENNLIMQSLSDISNAQVEVATNNNMAELGVAMAAGYVPEINVWNALRMPEDKGQVFEPVMTVDERQDRVCGWRNALFYSVDWISIPEPDDYTWTIMTPVVTAILLLAAYYAIKSK